MPSTTSGGSVWVRAQVLLVELDLRGKSKKDGQAQALLVLDACSAYTHPSTGHFAHGKGQ